jgi:hypothetical protein
MDNYTTNITNIQKVSENIYKLSIDQDDYYLNIELTNNNSIEINLRPEGVFQNYTAILSYHDLLKFPIYKITEKIEDIFKDMLESFISSEISINKLDDRFNLIFFSEYKKKFLTAVIDLRVKGSEPDQLLNKLSDMVKQLFDENKHKDRILAELKRKDDELETTLNDLRIQIQTMKKYLFEEIELVSFEFNDKFIYKNQVAGTNDIKDLSDRTCLKGICAKFPGWIIIELNKVWTFDEIEIGGYGGNPSLWGATNGANATVSTSTEKMNWNVVGTIPGNYTNQIQRVKLSYSSAKYIKFSSSNYLGIGYLNIIKKMII